MTRHFPGAVRAIGLAALLAVAGHAMAQNAGAQLQQPLPPQPQPSPDNLLPRAPAAAASANAAAGIEVTLKTLRIEGHTLFDTATLLAAAGPVEGRRFDLAGLEGLARAVAEHYRRAGYPFTQAFLPPQNLGAGELRIVVVEGRYGRVQPTGEDPLVPGAQPFLDALLRRGEPIHAPTLERAMLLVNDQPGFRASPVLRPGSGTGEGDLLVGVERRNRWNAEAALDNAGSRATGAYRARATLQINSPWRFGERISLSGLVSDKHLWLGSAEYEAPLNGHGTRAAASAARTSYQLDGALGALDASGRADVLAARFSHAVVRAQRQNLSLSLALQHKALQDKLGGGALVRDKTSRQAVATAQFDARDNLGGGAVTFGAASVTTGRLSLDADSAAADAMSAQTQGSFSKWNLDLARVQRLAGPFSGYLRVSAQGSGGNLDASEKLGIAGFLGVRAYPLGEAQGDRGWLSQMELRWDLGGPTVFVFQDVGRVRANARPWSPDDPGRRTLAGAGLGLRWLRDGFSVDATLAERNRGGAPVSDSRDARPRLFVSLTQRFD